MGQAEQQVDFTISVLRLQVKEDFDRIVKLEGRSVFLKMLNGNAEMHASPCWKGSSTDRRVE